MSKQSILDNLWRAKTHISDLESIIKEARDILLEAINKNSVHVRADHSQNCSICRAYNVLKNS